MDVVNNHLKLTVATLSTRQLYNLSYSSFNWVILREVLNLRMQFQQYGVW